jgi:hypothetical protein
MSDPRSAIFASRTGLALWISGLVACSADFESSRGSGASTTPSQDASASGAASNGLDATEDEGAAQGQPTQPTMDAGELPDSDAQVGVTQPTGSGSDAGAGESGLETGTGSASCTSLLCEDFERGQFDPATWTLATTAGTAVVEQTKAAHGKFAAQFHGTNASGYDFIVAKKAPPGLQTHHFGRAYVSIDPMFPTGHTGLLYASSAGSPRSKYMEVAGLRGGWQLNYVSLVPPASGEVPYRVGCTVNANGCIPMIQRPAEPWICLQWEFNDQPDQITLSVDGKQIATDSPIMFNNQTSNLVGGFVEFGFGFYNWHPDTNAFDVYYDDIALDSKPIGCL